MEVFLEVGCLPYAAGKQLSIPRINRGRKWTLLMMMIIKDGVLLKKEGGCCRQDHGTDKNFFARRNIDLLKTDLLTISMKTTS